jgi:hypothetical protein
MSAILDGTGSQGHPGAVDIVDVEEIVEPLESLPQDW